MFTVLIVDDSTIGRHIMDAILADANFSISFAADGQEAYDKTVELKPDFIILDIMMPMMDGIEVTEKIRATEGIANTPILIATALDDRDTRARVQQAGATDIIIKPIKKSELLEKVSKIVDSILD